MKQIQHLFNLELYPLDRPDSQRYQSVVAHCRRALHDRCMLNLEDFLSDVGIDKVAGEIDQRLPNAFHSSRDANPYGITETDILQTDHPYNILAATDRFGLAHHQLHETYLDQIYRWEPVRHFVGDVLNLDQIFLHEDPSNALVVQVYKSGGGLAWHFDRALYSTILTIRQPEDGGVFEWVANLRNDTDPCFDEVRDVLLDRSSRVQRCRAKPGSFTIISGRNTMHRVTANHSETPRCSAVLSYEDKPGVRLDAATRRLFFGPTAPA